MKVWMGPILASQSSWSSRGGQMEGGLSQAWCSEAKDQGKEETFCSLVS